MNGNEAEMEGGSRKKREELEGGRESDTGRVRSILWFLPGFREMEPNVERSSSVLCCLGILPTQNVLTILVKAVTFL